MSGKELDAIADEIIRVLYPTYEQAIPGMKNAIIRKRERIKQILKSHTSGNSLEECKNAMRRVADVFRHNDMYIQDLSIEDRTFLNDVGHIMDWLWSELLVYEHTEDEEHRRELRREVHGVRHGIELKNE